MILQEKYMLANEVEIPKVGLGTWFIPESEAAQAVRDAVRLGYRHIDTAQAYQNESGVGEGVKTCGLPREELFVTTKLAAEIKTHPEAVTAIDQSLQSLGLEYIDLLLIHSPKPWLEFHKEEPYFQGNREAWRAMEEAYTAGKVRAIGLSNFQPADVENILRGCCVKPMVHQLLAHISNTPQELIAYSQEKGMLVEAYSPIGHGELFKNKEIAAMAARYEVSLPQLAIRYCLELGLLPIPKTANPAHMHTNAAVDFTLAAEDMRVLQALESIQDYGEASMFPVYGGKLQ